MSKVDTVHPSYSRFKLNWDMMRDCDAGVDIVKNKGIVYLPMPEGFTAQPDKGVLLYSSYKTRAQFPEILSPTLAGIVGVIHRKEAKITMPKSMMYLWEKCTTDGLTLEEFHQKITTEIVLAGSYNILTDVTVGEPYFAPYIAEARINWSRERDFFVLDESGPVRNEFNWENETRHRVLRLRAGEYIQETYFEGEKTRNIEVRAKGNKPLDFIPLVTVGPRFLSVDLDASPLIGVARASLAMYRLDADYRYQLFMSSQETCVVTGVDDITKLPEYVGAGVIIGLPLNADMKYVGISGVGIEAHERALERERQAAIAAGTRLWDSSKREAESGRALEIRAAAQTATFTTISLASGKALERSLRNAAIFLGEKPESVTVEPNLDLVEAKMSAQEVVNMVEGWINQGYSYDTLYRNFQRGGITNNERTSKEEWEQMQKERAEGIVPPEKTPAPNEGGENGNRTGNNLPKPPTNSGRMIQ